MLPRRLLQLYTILIVFLNCNAFNHHLCTKIIKTRLSCATSEGQKSFRSVFTSFAITAALINPTISAAKDELPSLERCFNAVQKELDSTEGQSLKRIAKDIADEDWEDIKAFTREYDAGFRGGVLKSAWKQFDGDLKTKGIEISNSFTFDLIALNKAARVKDSVEATRRLNDVRTDLQNFLDLKSKS